MIFDPNDPFIFQYDLTTVPRDCRTDVWWFLAAVIQLGCNGKVPLPIGDRIWLCLDIYSFGSMPLRDLNGQRMIFCYCSQPLWIHFLTYNIAEISVPTSESTRAGATVGKYGTNTIIKITKVKVGVLCLVQQPGSYWERSSALPPVGVEPTQIQALFDPNWNSYSPKCLGIDFLLKERQSNHHQ